MTRTLEPPFGSISQTIITSVSQSVHTMWTSPKRQLSVKSQSTQQSQERPRFAAHSKLSTSPQPIGELFMCLRIIWKRQIGLPTVKTSSSIVKVCSIVFRQPAGSQPRLTPDSQFVVTTTTESHRTERHSSLAINHRRITKALSTLYRLMEVRPSALLSILQATGTDGPQMVRHLPIAPSETGSLASSRFRLTVAARPGSRLRTRENSTMVLITHPTERTSYLTATAQEKCNSTK